ncbi:MAG: hypothetical protein Q7V15_15410 [Phenylobacterium sp.]|uniref:hypothetical protein n=1 Tax=Phenylobacterium sp. TaxID=1871053 RepID=UPI0027225693|nr:hypothetical protein [Phenylobacterium sp.]MDO8902732.1 hypothetical protein [Phenylobacterium sp.]MDP2215187.1 hypothetical protein [Phenylobacterium sp.]
MSAYASPVSRASSAAFDDLCAVYDQLLGAGEVVLSEAARIDLRAFSRLYDLPLEEASAAEVWREVRMRLQQDLATPLQTPAEWGYEDQRQAA